MTQLLEKALAEVGNLTESEQDAIAGMIFDELAVEARWDHAFANSQPQLAELAAKARAQMQSGQVKDLGMDEL